MRNFHQPGRSPVYADNVMVATSHPLASSAAIDVMRRGGNAVDAAVAAAAVLAVVEPQMTGIGGDCFAIVGKPDGSLLGINGSGRSASGADYAWYKAQGWAKMPLNSPHSITVPGAVSAWETLLERAGNRGMGELFQQAIDYAENGFPVSPRVADDMSGLVDVLQKNDAAAKTYLKNGKALQTGDRLTLPKLAQTLKKIAANGAKAFYQGEVAADIANTIQGFGGFLSEEDLANHKTECVNPVSTHYNGHDIFELPPNGQGITALIMLNILSELGDVSDPHSAERYHREIEAAKLAYGVRDAFIADPVAMTTSVEALTSRAYGATLAKQFNADQAMMTAVPPVPNSDTIYLSVVDRDGMACSFINSLYNGFGSGIMAPESGVMLQNRGACFVLEEGHPNAIAPSKLPMHTIIPAMAMKDGKPSFSFGVMGGAYQACGHAHVLQNMLDYGLDPQAALDFPRAFWDESGNIALEETIKDDVATRLKSMGHEIVPAKTPHGGGQIIAIDHQSGTLIGGSDFRKDGLAIGY